MTTLSIRDLSPGFHVRRFVAGSIGFTAYIWRGGKGPMLLVNGATHGDEYEGPQLLRSWAETWRPRELAGTVVFIPVLNEGAFFSGRRCGPADGANLARSFPGHPRGRPTARLACLFDTQVLAQCTHYIDLHSAGACGQLDPWVGYMLGDRILNREQERMARCFDLFWCWSAPPLPQRTLSAAHARKIPALYVECRGAGGVHPSDLRALDAGLRQVITRLGLAPVARRKLRSQRAYRSRDADESHLQLHHPAPEAGLFRPAVMLRQRVRPGDLLGHLLPVDRLGARAIHAQRGGRVVTLRRQRSVQAGDALATVLPL